MVFYTCGASTFVVKLVDSTQSIITKEFPLLNAYLDISDSLLDSNITDTDGLSVALWAKRTYNTGNNNVLFSHRSSTGELLQLSLNSNNYPMMQYRDSSNILHLLMANQAVDSNYHHYTAVWDFVKKEMTLYVDGVAYPTEAITTT